jgi:hypothetical protein
LQAESSFTPGVQTSCAQALPPQHDESTAQIRATHGSHSPIKAEPVAHLSCAHDAPVETAVHRWAN